MSIRKALEISYQGYKMHPANYSLGMNYAQALIYNNRFSDAINVLKELQVLPFEGASKGRQLYEWAHYGYALDLIEVKQYEEAITVLERSKEWPEHLGVGQPFDADERFADYLIGHSYQQLEQLENAAIYQAKVLEYQQQYPLKNTYKTVLGLSLWDSNTLTQQLISNYDRPDLPPAVKWSIDYITNPTQPSSLEELSNNMELGLVQRALRLN